MAMGGKSVRSMTDWERKRNSISGRTFRAILRLAIIFGLAALAIGLGLSSWSLINHYIMEASSLSRSAVDVVEQFYDMKPLSQAVTSIYRGLSEDERQQVGTDAYYERFLPITEREDYKIVGDALRSFAESFDLGAIYMATFDMEHSAMLYILDPYSSEAALMPGDWEDVSREGIAKFMNWSPEKRVYEIANTAEYGLLCTSGAPIYGSDGEPAAFIFVDISMADVQQGMRVFVVGYVIALSIATVFICIKSTQKIRRRIVDPIIAMANAAQSYVDDRQNGAEVGNHFAGLNIRTGDEVENLSLVMADMEQSLTDYMDNLARITAEKERISTELTLATQIQESMLPHIFPAFPDRAEFDIYASMSPAKEVGGDFYDYFLIDDDHLGMVIADVSGKGVPAALFMMVSKIILQSNAIPGRSAGEILMRTNDVICEQNAQEMFVTVWLGILELSTGRVIAANAGHEYPAIMRAGGKFELYKDRHGFVIGGMEGVRYRDYELQLSPGDRLFVYTDGVAEATNSANELYGTERMIAALNIAPEVPPMEILKNVRSDVDHFVGSAPQFDDLTMLCIEYKGKGTETV